MKSLICILLAASCDAVRLSQKEPDIQEQQAEELLLQNGGDDESLIGQQKPEIAEPNA